MTSTSNLPSPFGAYVLLHRLGRGGMGEVFLASRGAPGALLGLGITKLTVVKMLRPELSEDIDYVTRFIDEAHIVVQLNHRNICQVHDVGKLGNTYFLAMEYIAGRDLKDLGERAAAANMRLPENVVLFIVRELLEALAYAHKLADAKGESLHLVHRDISPRNVMISLEGDVKLIDFGLAASRLKQSMTEPSFVMGKIAYMPPEQARHEPVDARADIFAAGILAYELLTGARYYEGLSADDMWTRAGVGDHLPKRLADLPPDLGLIVRRALAPDRALRWPSADAFRHELETYETGKQRATQRDLRVLMQKLFADEEKKARELLTELTRIASIVDTPLEDPLAPTATEVIASRTGSYSSLSSSSSSVPAFIAAPPTEPPQHHDPTIETPTTFPVSSSASGSSPVAPSPTSSSPIAASPASVLSDPTTETSRVVRAVVMSEPPTQETPRKKNGTWLVAATLVLVAIAAVVFVVRARNDDANTNPPRPPPVVVAPQPPPPPPPFVAPTPPPPVVPTPTAPTTTTTTTTTTLEAPIADAGVKPVAETHAPTPPPKKHVLPKKPAPPPKGERADRRDYVHAHCGAVPGCAALSSQDLMALPPAALNDYFKKIDDCIDRCVR